MIERKTTFILDAGAHCPYGFPSGQELKSKIVSSLHSIIKDNNQILLRNELLRNGVRDFHPSEYVDKFITALSNSGQSSIDAYLNANKHILGFEAIGKIGIAHALLTCESKSNIFNCKDDDWLRYIFGEMLNGVSKPDDLIKNNNVRFITFNYDRTLEKWFHETIQHSFGIGHQASYDLLKKIPIFHIYGALGTFPYYLDNSIDAALSNGWSRLKLIYELEHDTEELNNAKTILFDSSVVCFLGFGFHAENIRLLELQEISSVQGRSIFSSRYQLTDAEWERGTRLFDDPGRIVCSNINDKCLDALRNLRVF